MGKGKWVVVVVLVSCLVVAVAAVAYAAGQARTSAPEVLRAQRFELVDRAGQVTASLGVATARGALGAGPTLALYDEKGRPALTLAATREGPRVELLRPDGSQGAYVYVGPLGSALGLLDSDSAINVVLSASSFLSQASLDLQGQNAFVECNRVSWHRDAATELDPRRSYVTFGVDATGGGVYLRDGIHRNRGSLSVSPLGAASLVLADETGRDRAVVGVTELEVTATGEARRTAESSVVLFDRQGKVLWRAP